MVGFRSMNVPRVVLIMRSDEDHKNRVNDPGSELEAGSFEMK